MPLNDRKIKNAKPADKPYKLNDGAGLYLAVSPAGGKLWRFDYAFDRKRKTLSIGRYPAFSLVEAREAAEHARHMIADGKDPAAAKKQAKEERKAALLNTFEAIARRWHADNLHRWKANHAARIWRYLETDVFPHIGAMPITEIKVRHVKAVVEQRVTSGTLEIAGKIRQWLHGIFNYAAMLEITDGNPAAPLVGFLPKGKENHTPALPREELAEFYRRLLLADVQTPNRICIMLMMLCFARNTEIRGGEWAEIDFDAAVWTIPAERMKRPRVHQIPLSDWALQLLHELHDITGGGRFMFPSKRAKAGYISHPTARIIIEKTGYKGIATPHGFRSLASSVLNEQGFNPDAIERQLAHAPKNKIRAAYNRAEYWQERVIFMQWYSDYLRERYEQAKNTP